ncbi:helix-turn-helix domain-containing protein [Chryseobacterium sp.]|uniref:helix-turn-helix domain-containing protein n=1 Tax=Chryseobacterium sp. TaxID=1871047 RepID=UPI00289A25FB|nr:helix-turn-helix domain-containing protein [Chryseobacterium sp.]
MASKTFGDRLLQVLENKGFTKNSLAREAKVHPTTLKNWVSNETKPDDLKLDTLIKILGTTRDYLFNGSGEMYVSEVSKLDVRTNVKENISFKEKSIADQLLLIYNQNLEILKKIEKIDVKNEITQVRDGLRLKAIIEHLGINDQEEEDRRLNKNKKNNSN